jgi:periodic tryptophan protein 1
MISSLAWIPRGAARAVPDHAEIPEAELEAMRVAAEAQAASGVRYLFLLALESRRMPDVCVRLHNAIGDQPAPMHVSACVLIVCTRASRMQEDDGSGSEPDSDDASSEEDEAAAVARATAFAAVVKAADTGASRRTKDETLADAMAELDMEHYDSDDAAAPLTRILGGGNPGMAYHRNPRDDPYLRAGRPPVGGGDTDDDSSAASDSEGGDLRLSDADLLIMAARNEDDVSHLEVWVYEEPDERGGGNLYVHHAVMLSAFPLAVAWLDCDPRGGGAGAGNFAAVGSFEPGIEIWDLDVLDAVEPVGGLGGADYAAARAAAAAEAAGGGGKKKKKTKKAKGGTGAPPVVPVRPGSHEDAVLGLAWNREFRNVLASASGEHSSWRGAARRGAALRAVSGVRRALFVPPSRAHLSLRLPPSAAPAPCPPPTHPPFLPQPTPASRCGTSPPSRPPTPCATTAARCRRWPGTPQRRRCCCRGGSTGRPAL